MCKLVRIVEIMPYTIESAGNTRDRCEERISHPNCKDCVFLSEALRYSEHLVVFIAVVYIVFLIQLAYPSAACELYDASH